MLIYYVNGDFRSFSGLLKYSMDGWMDGWTDGWVDSRMDRWMDFLRGIVLNGKSIIKYMYLPPFISFYIFFTSVLFLSLSISIFINTSMSLYGALLIDRLRSSLLHALCFLLSKCHNYIIMTDDLAISL